MRKLTYLAVFETDENPGYSVYFPDIPGCVTCGDDFDHTLKMAREALGLHIYGMEKDGEDLPERTDVIPEFDKGDIVVPVSIYPDLVKEEMDERQVQTTITLPFWLKNIAEREGINYSQLLETAIKETIFETR
jgi:predicted RNase H-like HicB family nuclease